MIKPKKKKCSGTTPSTKGWGCGELRYERVYGLGKMCCYTDWLLNSEAGKLKMKKAELKATKDRRGLEEAEEEHKNRKGLTTLLKSVRTVCHKYIQLRDKGRPCISCDTQWKGDFHASHYYKSELYSTLRFDEYNINLSCVQCNIREEGNLSEYTERLPGRIGKDKFDELNRLAGLDKKINHKWDREELISLRNYFRNKIKSLPLK